MTDAASGALPAGKLPAWLLADLLATLPPAADVLLGPGIGRDVAVVDCGGVLLAAKSDPVTFATDRIGRYAVAVNANDIATAGADPRWFLATILLPAGAGASLAGEIFADLARAAAELGVALVGGHTEVTGAVTHPVVAGTMLGTIAPGELVRPDGLRPGDAVLLTKGMAIEATSIIAREMPDRLRAAGFSADEIAAATAFLDDPGIGVVKDARIVRRAGPVHAMHDPTEGGVVTALDELARAAGADIVVNRGALDGAIHPLARRVCAAVGIDPRGAISSGALLVGLPADAAADAGRALAAAGIASTGIGRVVGPGGACRYDDDTRWPAFARDEIVRLL